MMTTFAGLMASRAGELLKNVPFRALLSTRLFVVLGNQMAGVALGWRVYDLTHDPVWLGYIGLAEAVPAIALSLYGGYVADHSSRHKQMRLTILLLAVCLLMRVVAGLNLSGPVTEPGDWLPVSAQLNLLFASILLDGVARAFFGPAYFGLQAEVIPKQDLADGASMLSGTWQSAAVIGPALGGIMYAWGGPTLTFGLSLLLVIGSVIAMQFIPARPAPTGVRKLPVLLSIGQGLRFVMRHPIILGAITLDLFAVLFGGAVALLPAVSDQILHAGPQGLGVLRAAPAVGAVLMAVLLFGRTIRWPYGKTLLAAVAGFGVTMVVFGLSENFWLSLLALALSGALDHVSVVIRITIMQSFTPEHIRGRVSAVESIFITSSNEIGSFESGITAGWWGLQRAIYIGGLMSIGVTGLIAAAVPRLRRLTYEQVSKAATND